MFAGLICQSLYRPSSSCQCAGACRSASTKAATAPQTFGPGQAIARAGTTYDAATSPRLLTCRIAHATASCEDTRFQPYHFPHLLHKASNRAVGHARLRGNTQARGTRPLQGWSMVPPPVKSACRGWRWRQRLHLAQGQSCRSPDRDLPAYSTRPRRVSRPRCAALRVLRGASAGCGPPKRRKSRQGVAAGGGARTG